jgi:hypothetical protein
MHLRLSKHIFSPHTTRLIFLDHIGMTQKCHKLQVQSVSCQEKKEKTDSGGQRARQKQRRTRHNAVLPEIQAN